MFTSRRCITAVFLALAFTASLDAAERSANASLHRTGTVAIRTEKTFVLIGISPNGGGRVEDLFVFWPQNELRPSKVRYSQAEVRYDPVGTLTVAVPTEQIAITYRIAGLAQGNSPEREGFSGATLEGYGLNHTIGDERFSISGARRSSGPSIAQSYSTCYIDVGSCEGDYFEGFIGVTDTGGQTPSECLQGGRDAIACSYSKEGGVGFIRGGTSCSVGCAAGTYACCYEECLLTTCTVRCRCFKN